MNSAGKRCLSDFFHAKKKLHALSKDGNLLRTVTESTGKIGNYENNEAPTASNETRAASDILASLKRRISSSSDNNNYSKPNKRICSTPRQSNLLVSKDAPKDTLEVLKNRLNKLKQTVATSTETLNKSRSKPAETSHDNAVPAYERYAALATDDTSGLVLPYKYKTLLETFQCLDVVVSMLYNRKETRFIDKIQPSVQSMTRRTFTLNHLGQMVTVHPKAYILGSEPKPTNNFRVNKDGDQLQLTINPDLSDVSESGTKDGFIPMGPKVLTERKSTFKRKLIEITKMHHQKFLASLKKPIMVNSSEIRRWHPSFKVDSVPEIESAELPLPNRPQTVTTAKDVLDKVKGLYCKQLDMALETVAKNSGTTSAQSTSGQTVECPPKSNVKGIPVSLLEKIRAREAAKAISSITRDSVTENKLRIISRLPEIARIVKTLFVGERKTALTVPYVVDKIDGSYTESLTIQEIEDHLKLLSELVPEWLSVVRLKDGAIYYKLKREMDFNVVLDRIKSSTTQKM